MKSKNILLAFLLLGGLVACDDDEAVFDAAVPEGIVFTPVSGGAVMRYTLPKNTDICAV